MGMSLTIWVPGQCELQALRQGQLQVQHSSAGPGASSVCLDADLDLGHSWQPLAAAVGLHAGPAVKLVDLNRPSVDHDKQGVCCMQTENGERMGSYANQLSISLLLGSTIRSLAVVRL